MRIALGITGSSGAVFALEFLNRCSADVFLVVSTWGKKLLQEELGMQATDLAKYAKKIFSDEDLGAPLSSGTNHIDACVILPCSTSTLGKIASGIGDTLITRMAQVALKERTKLVLCIRETPLSTITLEQCAALSRSGVFIMPISPAMYYKPATLNELVSAYVDKVLAVAGVKELQGWRSEDLE
jgi:4-hydroxy-3-polyprenylbenzoate decarboxylase